VDGEEITAGGGKGVEKKREYETSPFTVLLTELLAVRRREKLRYEYVCYDVQCSLSLSLSAFSASLHLS
jgi:hypothetical protein